MKEYIVYMAVNVVNGKRYIGATTRGLIIRRRKHIADSKARRPGCRVFNAAIRKYGENSFIWEVIAKVASFDAMMKKEIELSASLRPQYNITRGGEGIVGLPRTKAWYDKVSKALKGRVPLVAIEGSRKRGRSYLFKSIVCLNDGRLFESIVAAAKYHQISARNIGEVLHGRQQLCGAGLCFVYGSEPLPDGHRIRLLQEMTERSASAGFRRNASKRKPVVCLNDGKRFQAGRIAAQFYGISPVEIMQACQTGGVRKGRRFAYADANSLS